jgi:hypothetical protein
MKAVSLGFVIASVAWMLLPQVAAAQCEGGSTVAGHYLTNGSYYTGGCAFTNSTTPGQLYPSGAQPLPSTNPAAGASALPGQRVATGQLPVATGDAGPVLGPVGVPVQTLGPGAPIGTGLGVYPGSSLAAGGLVNVGNGLGTTGLINGTTTTQGLPPTTVNTTVNGVVGTPSVVLQSTGVAAVPGTAVALPPSVLPGPGVLTGGSAYGHSLPAAPAVSSDASSQAAPSTSPAPPPPGRGGPTFIGEESGDGTTVAVPNE